VNYGLEPNIRASKRPSARRTRKRRSRPLPEQENAAQNLENDSLPEDGKPEDSQTESEDTNDILQELAKLRIARIEENRKERARIRQEMANRPRYRANETSPVGENQSPQGSGSESGLDRFMNTCLGPLVIIAAIVGLVFLLGWCSETPEYCKEQPGSCDDWEDLRRH